jgi:hypothetical protein
MPALLEKPAVEAPNISRANEIGVRTTVLKGSERDVVNPQRTTLSRKIFQGHEEYLGCTPD